MGLGEKTKRRIEDCKSSQSVSAFFCQKEGVGIGESGTKEVAPGAVKITSREQKIWWKREQVGEYL